MPTWDLGYLYMSPETARLWLNKFPSLKQFVIEVEWEQPFILYLDNEQTQWITITFFDANHWPGSIMMLFEGPMGTILHTGDFRFTPKFFNYNRLFPLVDNDRKGKGLATDIDLLIWDGTFSDPSYIFKSQEDVYTWQYK